MLKIAAFFLCITVLLYIAGNSWIPQLGLAAYGFFMIFIFFLAIGIVISAISRLKAIIHEHKHGDHHHSAR